MLTSLLVVGTGRPELSDLADEFSMFSSKYKLAPYLADNAQDALEVLKDEGRHLKLTILPPDGQSVYDKMRQAGYQEKFLVYAPPSSQPAWGKRDVVFFPPAEDVTAKVVEAIVDMTLR